jgi:FAD binding domain
MSVHKSVVCILHTGCSSPVPVATNDRLSEKPKCRKLLFQPKQLSKISLRFASITSNMRTMNQSSFIEQEEDPLHWFDQRAWAKSGIRIVVDDETSPSTPFQETTQSKTIYYPTTTEQVSDIIKSSPPQTPIAAVCGGNEASNAPMVANQDGIILDFKKMKGISLNGDAKTVTVQAGVVFRDLAT